MIFEDKDFLVVTRPRHFQLILSLHMCYFKIEQKIEQSTGKKESKNPQQNSIYLEDKKKETSWMVFEDKSFLVQ